MNILITVDTGQYKNVYEGNEAKDSINWWNEYDKRAIVCTQCFLAIDLCEQLSKVEKNVYINDDTIAYDTIITIGKENTKLLNEQGKLNSYIKDGKRIIELYGENREGSINAVYEFLKILGFRYYNTDSYSNIFPNELIIKDFNYITQADFITRGCYNAFIDDENYQFIEWMTRNRMNMLKVKHIHHANELKKRGIKLLSGGHEIFYNFLNPNTIVKDDEKKRTYYQIHPEWFALIDGKRSNRDENKQATEGYHTGDNICTSNVEGVKELTKNMIVALDTGYLRHCDLLNLWAYDNGRWCDCDECKKTGNYSTRILLLAYQINKSLRIAFEEKKLGRMIKLIIPIYHETLEPPIIDLPTDFDYENIIITYFPIERCYTHYINDEKCTETNLRLKKLFDTWSTNKDRKYKGEVFIGEYFNVSSFASLPFIFTDIISHDLPYYFNNNTRHFYYMHISTDEWGMLTLNNHLIANLLYDIKSDCNSILNEYYDNIYPESKIKMKEFHKILEKASTNAKYLKHYQFSEVGKEKPSLMWKIFDEEFFPLKHCKFDTRVDDYNSGISFVEMIDLFNEAKILIENISESNSLYEEEAIDIENMRFQYGYNVMNFLFHLVKLRFAHQKNNTDDMKAEYKFTEKYRSMLENYNRPIKEAKYECTPWLNDAFNATWVANRYIEYIESIKERLI